MARTAALKLGFVSGWDFVQHLFVTANARTVTFLGMEGHKHTHGVTLARTWFTVAFRTGYISSIRPYLMVTLYTVDTSVCCVRKDNIHACGQAGFNFQWLFYEL